MKSPTELELGVTRIMQEWFGDDAHNHTRPEILECAIKEFLDRQKIMTMKVLTQPREVFARQVLSIVRGVQP